MLCGMRSLQHNRKGRSPAAESRSGTPGSHLPPSIDMLRTPQRAVPCSWDDSDRCRGVRRSASRTVLGLLACLTAGSAVALPEPTPATTALAADPTVEFTTAASSGTENGAVLVATLSLSAVSATDVSVPFQTSGSLTAGSDYSLDQTSPVTIPAGSLSASVTLTAIDDSLDEDDETLTLTLGTPTGATLGTQTTHTYTLQDDDASPTVSFAMASQSGAESAGSLTVDLVLSAVSGREVSVPISQAGTAVDPDDYSLSANPVIIPAGQQSGTLTLTLVDDSLDEEDETASLTMGTPVGATLGATTTHTVTLVDDDAPPTIAFSIASQAAPENGGTIPVNISLSAPSGRDVSVSLAASGTALDPDDYSLSATSVTISAGNSGGSVDVVPVDDVLSESDETVVLTLTSPTNATLGSQSVHTLTLQDDDALPTLDFQAASSSLTEGGGSLAITLQLSAVSGQDVSVPFVVTGDAIDPDDYGLDASPVVIPAGQATFDLTLQVVDDSLDENDETVVLTLGTPTGADLGATLVHTATLLDDDAPPSVQFTLSASSSLEGGGPATIEVDLSGPSGKEVSVPFSLSGDAQSPDDYSFDASPLVLPAGTTTAQLTLTPVDDALHEADETVQVDLGTPTDATLGGVSTHLFTLLDDDDAPTVDFQIASQSALETAGSVSAVLVLSAPSGLDVSVPFTVAGTAANPEDYTLDPSPILIPAGQTSADLWVSLVDDILYEPGETVEITLGSPQDGQLGTTTQHILTITSDDPLPTVEFTSSSSSSGEGVGQSSISLGLSAVSGVDVSVPITTSGTATEGVDYTLDQSTILIPAGSLTGTTSVTAIPDAMDEADETVVLTLGPPSGADFGSTTVHTLTLVDDDPPPSVAFQLPSQSVDEGSGTTGILVQLSAVSGLDITVPFTVSGDATANLDYTIDSSPLSIPAGQSSASLSLTVLEDTQDESAEQVRISIDSASLVNAVAGAPLHHRFTIQDNDGPDTELDIAGLRPDVGSIDPPVTEIGQASGPFPVVLTNTQHVPITFKRIVIDGGAPADYQITYDQAMPVLLQPGDTASFQVTFQPTQYGLRQGVARVVQKPHGAPDGEVRLNGIGRGLPGDELRMTAGPDPYLDGLLHYWSPDFGETGDSAYLTTTQSIVGTSDPSLYQVARVGGSFGYSLELPSGQYEVVPHFAEIQYSGAGQRVFDLWLEGTPVITGLDLVVVAGANAAWTPGPLPVTVTDGSLDLDLFATTGEALLSALEVRSVPSVDSDQSAINFGLVDQGSSASQVVNLTNSGLAPGKITQVGLVLDAGAQGSGEDFFVRLGSSDYYGATTSVYYSVDFDLPEGSTTPIEVHFVPTEHQDNILRIELFGDFGMIPIDVSGTGGANSDWGFLHPVISYTPPMLVDYDEDGSETVTLYGFESHTHEPGQSIVGYDWAENSVSFDTQVNTARTLGMGTSTISLTITDDKPVPDSATEHHDFTVYAPDSVPGMLVSYYDGLGDPVFLLSHVPSQVDYMERTTSLLIADQGGKVGNSPFSGDVMVRWILDFYAPAAANYDFVASGGVQRSLYLDGSRWGGASQVSTGNHELDVRFAVSDIAELPLQLSVIIDGQQATGWGSGVVHDERTIVPVLHSMPTVGSELGGNLITMDGFGFFPKDQVTVHWGTTDYTLADFVSWTAEQIELYSPPGTGSVSVTVETPNGISNSIDFVYSPDGPVPIKFNLRNDRELTITNPTTAVWHPNGKLYVGTLDGKIYEITFDDDWVSSFTVHTGISNLTNYDLLGIAVNPYDPPSPVKLYVAHGEHFLNGGGSFSGPSPFTGQISVLTGPNFDNPVPLVTSLPTSNHDHGVNGIEFDNNGDLLISAGGNTNAGVPWPLMGDVPASPFSGAILKALTSKPGFNGAIQYISRIDGTPIDDQVLGEDAISDGSADIEVFASGQRNAYDLVLTTAGRIYATDNGPNVGYGPASTGADTDSGIHPQHDDELNLIREGNYYGWANRNRGFDDPREYIWRDVTEPADADYTPPLHLIPSSADGIAEYRAQTFNSQLRGRLVVQKWNSNQYMIELTPDGSAFQSELLITPLAQGLDVITGPGGALLAMDYTANRVRILEPDDASAVGTTVHDILPWRTPSPGGTPFVIGGEGFVDGQTTVQVGGVACTLTSVTPRRIHGIFPALPENNIGSLYDVVVQVNADVVTLSGAVLSLPATPGLMKGFWVSGASLPDSLGEVACGVVGQTLYLFGEGTNKTYAYDLLSDTWVDNLAVRPYPGTHHACEVVGGKVYLFGGLGGGSEGRVQIYDPASDTWSVGQDMAWAGGSCNSAVIGGKVYVCGGIVGNTTVGNLSVYDPVLDDWDQGGSLNLALMSTPVNHAASATDGNKLWVFGGRQGGNVPQDGFDTVQCYDPQTDSWDSSDLVQSSLAPMPLGRGGTGKAVYYKGEMYVFGGEDTVSALADVQVYSPQNNTWRAESPLPTPRHGIFPVLFQSRIYVAGGGVVAGFSSSNLLEIFQRP